MQSLLCRHDGILYLMQPLPDRMVYACQHCDRTVTWREMMQDSNPMAALRLHAFNEAMREPSVSQSPPSPLHPLVQLDAELKALGAEA